MAEHDLTKAKPGSFLTALANAEVGDDLLYHVGEFAGGPHKRAAMLSFEGGKSFIFRRKLGPGLFAHYVRKTRKPMP